MKSSLRLICAASTLAALAFASSANAQTVTLIIDNFNDDQFLLAAGPPSGPKSVSGTVLAPVLGGERDGIATRTSNNSGSTILDVNESIPNALALADSPATKGTVQTIYDGIDGSATSTNFTGLGGVNFTMNGGNAIFFRGGSDLGGTVTFTVYTNATNYSVFTQTVPGSGASSNFLPYVIPFSAFTVGGGSGANFASVGALSILVAAAVPDADVAIDVVGVIGPNVVPEPGIFPFIGAVMGMGAFFALRRRRRA